MNYDNKPVAWIALNQLNGNYVAFTNHQKTMLLPHIQQMYANWKPLYTHPAKILTEPSVKEIEDLWLDVINNISANDHRPREWHFAKAILRKAQEK